MNKIEKIIEYGLYLLVFLLPIQTRWIIKAGELNGGYWEYGTISLYGVDILLIMLLLFVVIRYKKEKLEIRNWKLGIVNKFQIFSRSGHGYARSLAERDVAMTNFKFHNVWWFIWGLLAISAVSIFFASDRWLGLYKLGWLVLGVGLFCLMVSAEYDKIKLIHSFLAGIFLQAALGIWQFLRQASFANKWLGLAMHKAGDLGTSVVETIGTDGVGERWLRAYGGLDHPNVLGGVLVIGVILLIFLILKYEIDEKKEIGNWKLEIWNSRYLLYILLLTFFISLLFTFSRGAWLALIVGMVVWLGAAVIKRQLQMQKILLEIILVFGIIFFIIFNQYQNLFITRAEASGRLEIKSGQERLRSYQEAWQIIEDDWLTGVGIGNYTLAMYEADNTNNPPNPLYQGGKKQSYDYQPVHNTFLLIWVETGILGLLFYICIIIYLSIFNFQFSIYKQFSIFNFIILLSIIVIMLFDHWLWSLHFGVLFFWLLAGLVARRNVNFVADAEIKSS